MITFSKENNHKNEGKGVRKPAKYDYVTNGGSLAHAVHCFGYENDKHTLFPNMFMEHYLQIEYDLQRIRYSTIFLGFAPLWAIRPHKPVILKSLLLLSSSSYS